MLKVAFTFVAQPNVLLICIFWKVFSWERIGLQRIIYNSNFGREKGGMDEWKIQVVLIEWRLVQWPSKLWWCWMGRHCCGCHTVPAVTWLQFGLLAHNCNVTTFCNLMFTICDLHCCLCTSNINGKNWQEVAIGRIRLTTAIGTSATPVVSWSSHIALHFTTVMLSNTITDPNYHC